MSEDQEVDLGALEEGLKSIAAKRDAYVDASSTATGVTKSETFETAASDIHGYGTKDFDKLNTRLPSTKRENLPSGRAGEVYDDQGTLPDPPLETVWDSQTGVPRERFRQDYHDRNDPAIATGNVDDILRAATVEAKDAPLEALVRESPFGIRSGGHGSRSSGRKRTNAKTTKPRCENCFLQDCAENCMCILRPGFKCLTCVKSRRKGADKKANLRTKIAIARVSPRAKAALMAAENPSLGDILDGVAQIMIQTGQTWEQIAARCAIREPDSDAA